MTTVLFGSISTLADTSELQREAFNKAFAQHGLDWSWSRDEYVPMLAQASGEKRIAGYASQRGETVDAAAVHATKSQIFQSDLAGGATPRPGVVETIKAVKDAGGQVGLVTTTSPANVEALLAALAPAVQASDFAVVVDSTSVSTPKPDGAAYTYALGELGADASSVVAVEDNTDGVASAVAAGVEVVAFPNQNTTGGDFSKAREVVETLDPATLGV